MKLVIEHCIETNNRGVEQFELGHLRRSVELLKEALESLSALISISPQLQWDAAGTPIIATSSTPLHRWSRLGRFDTRDKDDVFIHRRAMYIFDGNKLDENVINFYATSILYNIALCHHALSLSDDASRNQFDYSEKAYQLYNMAFASMKDCKFKDNVLITVLFNNSAHILHYQGRTCEAAKCLRIVQDLMIHIPIGSLEGNDYHGLFLNSLMDSNAASAA